VRTEEYVIWCNENPDKIGRLTRLAVERFEGDLKRKDIFFDSEYVDHLIETTEKILCFWEGEWAGQPVKIYPFQAFIIGNVYGWKKPDGTRRFKSAYIQIARKNGKTTLLDIIFFIHLLLDDENTPFIAVGANNEEQAKICTTSLCKMIINSPLLFSRVQSKKINPNRYGSQYRGLTWTGDGKDAVVKAMSADADTKDGLNISFAGIDEYHEAKNSKLLNVFRSSQVLRANRMLITITTAGFNKNYPCYTDLRKLSVDVLSGTKDQDSHFSVIYELDEKDDYHDKSVWIKSNPLKVHFDDLMTNYLTEEYINAINSGGADEVAFRTKNLNEWTDSAVTWLSSDVIRKNNGWFRGDLSNYDCYVGLDLSKSIDLSVVGFLFDVGGGKFVYRALSFIPSVKLLSGEDSVDYKKWSNAGWVKVHEGNVLDHDIMSEDILEECRKYKIKSIGFDSKYAYQGVVTKLAKNGYEDMLIPVGQGFNLSASYSAIEMHCHNIEFDFQNNPMTAWNFSNVEMITGNKGDRMASKAKSKNKIDIVTTLATAYSEYLRLKRDEKETEIVWLD
jgi:phage terminase large subunit-like protein